MSSFSSISPVAAYAAAGARAAPREIRLQIIDNTDDTDDDDVVSEKAPDWTPEAPSWIITFRPKVSDAVTPVTGVSVPPSIQQTCAPQSHVSSWNELLARHGVDADAQELALEPGVWHPNQRANMDWVKSLMNNDA
jgi:hypothetical protein